jgi:uroporphyrinogen III methyltransferase/synthase
MGVRALPEIVRRLRDRGTPADKPVALVRWGTTVNQEVVTGTLATIEDDVRRAGLKPPALIVVGDVVNLREKLRWFDNRPLWGQTVVVTRAREQASGLVEDLRRLGANVVQCPTIQVQPLDDYSVLDESIGQFPEYQWVVFTSTNGVDQFFARLNTRGLDTRALGNIRVAAIGPATVKALNARGIQPDLVPSNSISESVAEELLGAIGPDGTGSTSVLIVRAAEGREVLEAKLREAGVSVRVAPCYRTVPDASNAPRVRELLEAGQLDWVTFTSSSTVRNFLDALGAEFMLAHRSNFKVAVIGPVTAATAREAGLDPDVIAESASVESLAAALGAAG